MEELLIEGRRGGLIIQSSNRTPVVIDEEPVSVVFRESRPDELVVSGHFGMGWPPDQAANPRRLLAKRISPAAPGSMP